ncbi:MAG: extracellular solute-binding protein [Anaerolineae bacterium]|nr:extracellular solute-binding protein [Anaerolineae bacterium]
MRKNIKVLSVLVLIVVTTIAVAVPALASNSEPTGAAVAQFPAVDLLMWSKESTELMDAIGFEDAFAMWAEENAPGSTLTLETLDVEQLRTELQTLALAGEGVPHLLWTVADHAGPFTEAGIIQPLDDLFDMSNYLNTVNLNGQTWGIPFSAGNHLMLIYNKSMIETPPATVEELVEVSKGLMETYADVEGFVPFLFSHEESFWVFPWMQAINPDGVPFVGFAADGVTPDLNNDSLIKTYELLYNFKAVDGITASECGYECLDGFFKEGNAAMTINGDWSLGGETGMIAALGDDLGLAPFPMFEGGQPAPLIGGTYAMIPTATQGDELAVVQAFLEWYTTDITQILKYTLDQGRLPGYLPAFDAPEVVADPLVGMSAAALATGVPQPVNVEMRCLFDAVKQEYQAVMNGSETPEEAAANAQDFAEQCIADFE